MAEGSLIQKAFSGIGLGSSRIPLRSNIHGGARGYSPIGTSGAIQNKLRNMDRKSPILGTAQPTKFVSGWYEKMAEIKQYELLDISKLAVSVFRDYVNNFISKDASQLVTIQDEEGNTAEEDTRRINTILQEDIRLLEYIRDHLDEAIYYGAYYSMLQKRTDEKGHTRFKVHALYDPVAVIIKRSINSDDEVIEEFFARSDDGNVYVIPSDECFYLGSPSLRLVNDLDNKDQKGSWDGQPGVFGGEKKESNRDKVRRKFYYSAGEPIFYSTVLKVKELVVKELIVSIISLRDLVSPSLFGVTVDKSFPIEMAQDLCAKLQKLTNNYQELSSFVTGQFDATSIIESMLTDNIKFFPDYGANSQNKGLINLDKLSDKFYEVMQTIDQTKQAILSPLGIPVSMVDGTSGSKWQVLQQSERLNSRVNSIMSGISDSVTALVRTVYKSIKDEEIDSSRIKVHLMEKSTVEYNNTLNTLENVQALVSGVTNIIMTAQQTLDASAPLVDPKMFINWFHKMIKDADPNAGDVLTEETIQEYIQLAQLKYQQMKAQFGGMEEEGYQ